MALQKLQLLLLQLLNLVRLKRDIAPSQCRLQDLARTAGAIAQHGDVGRHRDRDSHGRADGVAGRGGVDDKARAGASITLSILYAALVHGARVTHLQYLAHLLGLKNTDVFMKGPIPLSDYYLKISIHILFR